ncbi:MAG: phosphate--AMP phosphotransferase [Deltaproteobacteria bacterium]|nr:phosphate--AMP phosphotransferase [Deltaproteobacteria bacterium]
MLETVDLKRKLDRVRYERLFRPLRDRLSLLQRAVYEARIPVLVVFEGWDAAGKGDTIEKLVGRIDPRGYEVHVTRAPTEEEELRPFLWRFWVRLPERGGVGIFDRSWYRRVLSDRVERGVPKAAWRTAYDEINQFERMLADDGTLIVKFFLHISREEQRRRFEKMERSADEAWRVTRQDWKAHRKYGAYAEAAEEMLERTSTPWAPWTVVAATDKRHRRVQVFETLAEAMERALLAHREKQKAPKPRAARPPRLERTVLDDADLGKKLSDERYEKELSRWQDRLRALEFACYRRRVPVVVGYEGWDAAGKGGSIRRVIGSLDPRGYTVIPIAAPKGDEATHHYLWRFWKRIPKAGHIALFDRTWYGRLLVERVEGFCAEPEWRRAFHEINEFERSLANFGAVLVKFWLHVSPETQLRRFKEREKDPAKRYKITDEDWRNREKWQLYRTAVHDMVSQTSTSYAPWTIVEADDKNWARIRCLKTLVEAVERRLE